MDSQRRAIVARSKRGALKLLLLLPMLVLFAGCDLAITKTDTPDPVNVGESLTYTLNVSNTPADPPPPQGQGGQPQVLVTDTLPDSVDFVSANPSQGACTPPAAGANVVNCDLGSLALNSSATIEIVVVPRAAGEIQNTASVQSGSFPPVALQESPSITQQQYGNQTCSSPIECDPQGNNTTTITTTVIDPAGPTPPTPTPPTPTPPTPTPPETPTPPDDQYSPGNGQPGNGQPGGASGFPAGNACVNVVSGINAVAANNATQSAGDDTASQNSGGDGNAQTISQAEARAIAQDNNTTIDVVQQCAQDSGVNVSGGEGTATNLGTDTTGNATGNSGSATGSVSGNAASAVDTLDSNNDGVISEAEARTVLGDSAAAEMAAADADGNGTVSVAEAKALASKTANAQAASSAKPYAGTGSGTGSGTISVLPDTGGASLFTFAGGALLVASGLVARRIFRQ